MTDFLIPHCYPTVQGKSGRYFVKVRVDRRLGRAFVVQIRPGACHRKRCHPMRPGEFRLFRAAFSCHRWETMPKNRFKGGFLAPRLLCRRPVIRRHYLRSGAFALVGRNRT